MRGEVKEFLKQTKAEAGTTIYKDIKMELLSLYAIKEEESFERACQMLLDTKPSALLQRLAEELCQ